MTTAPELESELRELRARRDDTIAAAVAVLEGEGRALDTQIAAASARMEAAKAAEAAERRRIDTAALRDAVARFCNHGAALEDALGKAVDARDREWAVLEAIKAVRSLEVALRPRQMHSRTYAFADDARTVIRRNDGATFVWPLNTIISNVNGRVAEQYRFDGCPLKRE
jgi:hypothetical protein